MLLDTLRFASLLLTALASGVVLSHVLERPGKLALAPATYVEVQQTLFRTYGTAVGALETLALLTRPRGGCWTMVGWWEWPLWPKPL